jgi:hypothetical protein
VEGQYVTGREFDLMGQHLASVEGKVDDVARDVKALLAAHNREEGAWTMQAIQASEHKDKCARRLGWGGIAVGFVSALWWVQDAVAKIHHG